MSNLVCCTAWSRQLSMVGITGTGNLNFKACLQGSLNWLMGTSFRWWTHQFTTTKTLRPSCWLWGGSSCLCHTSTFNFALPLKHFLLLVPFLAYLQNKAIFSRDQAVSILIAVSSLGHWADSWDCSGTCPGRPGKQDSEHIPYPSLGVAQRKCPCYLPELVIQTVLVTNS